MKNKFIQKGLILLTVCMLAMPLMAKVPHANADKCKASKPCFKLFARQGDTSNKDIVDIVAGDQRFKTLGAAIEAADLTGTLKSEGPFTVFAPTDEAFAKLPAGTLDNLLKPENKGTLADILKYHVAPGKLTAADVTNLAGQQITMANGDKAKIEVKDGSVFIDGAKVIVTDIMAKNGIIHVIDTVILPPNN